MELYLQQELERIAEVLMPIEDGEIAKRHVVPEKPRFGLFYADGADWDPGNGEGIYVYDEDSAAFEFVGGAGAGAGVDSFEGRTGPVTALQADYDGFFLTPAEGNAAYSLLGHGHVAVDISDFDTEVSNNASVAANTSKVTNATHTGEVTGATLLTIALDAVTYAKMQNVVADERLLGNIAGAGAIVAELTPTQVRTMINVESGATADQTNTEIRDAVEAAANSNTFNDTDHTKLNGIETSATADQSAAEIEAIVNHNNLLGFLASEHLRWDLDLGGTNLHANNSANGALALTAGEITQLANIGGTVITAADWTAVAALVGINTGDQTSIVGITGTRAQFNTAVTDGDIAYIGSPATISGAYTFTGIPILDAPIGVSGFGTGGRVKDGDDNAQPVGFNVLDYNARTSALTLTLASNGQRFNRTVTTAFDITCPNLSTLPVGSTWVFTNQGASGVFRIKGATGVTVRHFTGDAVNTVVAGNGFVVATGGAVTINKVTNTEYHIWGAGLTTA